MSQVTKLTTGLTGLVVSKNPHHTLGILYNKIMRTLQNMPEGAAYRKHTESVIKERTAILKSTTDVASIEKKIGCGQIEEVIMQAENELILARKMMAWKPWEPLMKEAPPNQWSWPPVQSRS
ncbi:unnamed protein product [Phyllotreta striolata]|uniref:NADH dehydrogenase [ubiquinone] 1 alpha subcomplex subunit 5 n=1 Tax=Phyllotreta striolata TaxID=444603 RepID=A0A9N9TM37_PHYSR|nr:unnamed protein product [Phyllotreta striolata]